MSRILHTVDFGVKEASHKKHRPMRSFFEEAWMMYPRNNSPEARTSSSCGPTWVPGPESVPKPGILPLICGQVLSSAWTLSSLRARDYILYPLLIYTVTQVFARHRVVSIWQRIRKCCLSSLMSGVRLEYFKSLSCVSCSVDLGLQFCSTNDWQRELG